MAPFCPGGDELNNEDIGPVDKQDLFHTQYLFPITLKQQV